MENKEDHMDMFLDADQWYTKNFDKTYEDIVQGLEGFFKLFKKEKW